jgi:hypothetical protein
VIIPPRSTGVPTETAQTAPTQRDRHFAMIAQQRADRRAKDRDLRSLGVFDS